MYKSTRGDNKKYSFSEVLLKGIAADGGLFIPEKIPKLTLHQLTQLSGTTYQKRAVFVLNLFKTGFPKSVISNIVNQAYSTNFDTPLIAPLIHLKDNQYVLELWHGPTLAFKDMALQIMPLFFSKAIKKPNRYLILVATSGDTGKAALEGYKDKENISIIVFFPDKHVSKIQELQMTTQEGSNVAVIAIKGDFDKCQKLVKEIFNDIVFNQELNSKYKTILSSANSINWARLIPQIVYHVSGYVELIQKKIIVTGDPIDISVPTGNFGNILSAYYAKCMGLPIRKLICASNENNVLTEFLKTGIYDIRGRSLIKTPSPSMDILVASNIERLLYLLTKNPTQVSDWMNNLKLNKFFAVDDITKNKLKDNFYADWVSNEESLTHIKTLSSETKYLIDPHTSVAHIVAERYIAKTKIITPIIICSTAHWSKFSESIIKGPKQIKDISTKKIIHRLKCVPNLESVKTFILRFLAKHDNI